MDARRKVLITGAAGRIGTAFRERYGDRYDLRLVDRNRVPEPGEHEHCVEDLVSLDSALRVCEGVDTVIHLAADPSPRATFYDTLLPLNVQMTYNMFHAAVAQKCRRLIFASSIHAVNAYPLDYQIHPADPVLPGDLYGVTKCWGEALCAYYGSREGLSCIAIRIGAFGTPERLAECNDSRLLSLWVSHDDLSQLIHRCIEAADDVRFLIVQGVSDNQLKRMDISNARELRGYAPQDNAFAYSSHTSLLPRKPNDSDV